MKNGWVENVLGEDDVDLNPDLDDDDFGEAVEKATDYDNSPDGATEMGDK
jgi:hypothetical protein